MKSLRKSAAVFAMAIGCGAALAACSPQGSTGSAGPETAATSAADGQESSANSGADSAAGSDTGADSDADASHSTGADGGGTPGTTDRCTAANLDISINREDAAAGSLYYTITLKNTGKTSCHLNGHPGVSAVGSDNGTQLGKSARLGGPKPSKVTLAPGKSGHASLKAVNIGSDGGPLAGRCKVTRADGWRIYPPDSHKAVFVKQSGLHACSSQVNWLTVGAVTE